MKKDSLAKNINKKIGDLPISRELKRVDKSDLLVSSIFKSVYILTQWLTKTRKGLK